MTYGLVASFLAILAVAFLSRAYRYWKHHHKHGFGYEVAKDFFTPLLLAAIGFGFAVQLNRQQVITTENQSKETALREMVTTRNGPDVAFFTAVGERLTIHIQRYQKLQSHTIKGATPDVLNTSQSFEERAIYFFGGMYRVAVLDFLATKGYVLYPRTWMEEAFGKLNHGVVENFIGTKEQLDPHPQEQAALYRYFGAMKAFYHTGAKPADEALPDLFEFNLILENALNPTPTPTGSPNATASPNPYHVPMVEELKQGFLRFQKRLHGENKDSDFRPHNVVLSVEAMIGLDDYAFNSLFSHWYGQFDSLLPVDLSEFCCEPPPDFLPYPLTNFEETAEKPWPEERRDVWLFILGKVPPELKQACGQNKTPCPK
jgi:hypothetical protein